MKRSATAAMAVGVVTIVVGGMALSAPPKVDPTPGIMRLKLDHAKALLEGIALENFDGIARNAAALSALTQQAQWKAIDDPGYLDYSLRMRKALDAMAQQARAKNLDGVTFNYIQVTMTCVDCHKFIRDAAKVDAGSADPLIELAARLGDR